ncbi:hypothetical protein LNQ52_12850 [Klebsiella pneumoniae subsp. pneumoniae]|nr:hypothetical protein [Klebsiella pneumoniae subsp. pneumoniae]
MTFIVKVVIRFAPLGIFGLVSSTTGDHRFRDPVGLVPSLLLVLVGCMLLVALVINPLLVFWKIPPQPLSAGAHLPARKRRLRVLHPAVPPPTFQ